ncbi:MAG: DinB family protein [Acidobacteriaceae bacterium]|nr:DinB family protein [Acidobacteriaceae bacterium]
MHNAYAEYLGDRDPVAVLAATPGILYRVFSPLLATEAGQITVNTPSEPGKWSLREVLAHLADCELAFGFRFRQALADPNNVIQPFDQDQWARHYAPYDAPSALATFVTLRNWNMLLLNGLQPHDWDTPVNHPERGTGTFRDLVGLVAGHDLNHLQRIAHFAPSGTA